MGLVTRVSTASGLAPGKGVLTTTIGKSRAGRRSTPSLVQETRPTTSSAPITIKMNSGRLIEMLVSHIRVVAPWTKLGVDLLPALDFPIVVVSTPFPGASPDAVD